MTNKRLNTTITIGGAMTSGLKSALGSTTSMLKGIGKSIGELNRKQRELASGIATFKGIGASVDGLRLKYLNNIKAIDQLRLAQKRLNDAQQRQDRINARAKKIGAVGAGSAVAGGVMIGSVVPGVKEAKHYQTEQARIVALGMGEDTNKKAFRFAKDMKTFGTSALENLELLRDGMSVFADLHHAEMVAPLMAKMKFGNKAVFGQERGESNSAQFMDMLKVIETRGGLKSEAEFSKQANIIQQVISATGGRVGATEWRHMLMTGGLAGKGMSSESLFYTMEHLVQEMGGDRAGTGLNSMYKSLYQGVAKKRAVVNLGKLGLIGDQSKVKHDKAGQTSSMEPGALLGASLFRENPFQWMEQVLLPQLAKKGITEEKQVIDTIGMIVSNSVGGSFLAEMYRQRENIHRAEKRNRKAQNIDELYNEGQGNAGGKEIDAQAKLADLKLRLGDQILPLYTKALTLASGALERFNKFSADNPRLTNALVVGFTAVGVSLAVVGPLLVAASASMVMYAGAQMMLTRAAVGGAAAGGIGMLGRALSSLAGVVPGLLSVVRPLVLAFLVAGSPMLVVAGAAAAIAAAGLAIYKYWEPLKAFFVGFGEGLSAGMQPFVTVIQPIVMPILEAVGTWVKSAVGWFGQLLTPISAASDTTKAFGEAGKACGEVIASAFTLMLAPINLVKNSIQWITENASKVGSLFKGGGSVPNEGMQYDAMGNATGQGAPAVPPMRGAAAAGGAGANGGDTYHITQLPGENAEALARRISEIQKRQQGVQQRGALTDGTR